MGPKIFAIFLLVVVGGGLLYVSQSGLLTKLSPTNASSSPFFFGAQNATDTTPTTTEFTPQTEPSYVIPPVEEPRQSEGLNTPPAPEKTTPEINPAEIPEGYIVTQLSPHFHKIRFSYVSAGSSQDNYYGVVALSGSFEGSETINITGWRIKANRTSIYIPTAANFYYPSGVSPEGNIYLRNGDTLNIYLGVSSAVGQNFRLNQCTGYLTNNIMFTPEIPRSCPYINQSEIKSLSGQCQNYVNSLGGCSALSDDSPISPYDYECREYLKTFNYAGCFDKYKSQTDFLSNEWRVWFGSWFLDPFHDQVTLFDRNGLLVDYTSY